ncbi:MAG: PD40 domain-containing protein [Cytophagaceae bacterium]|nr:PD40 domain-containing protein [Cytophagaceae bacterium]MBK9510595.1 PD40 domain-containing protein [Cytophagaceae bacterium]
MKNLSNDVLEDYSPDWSPDGKWIAYSSGTSK